MIQHALAQLLDGHNLTATSAAGDDTIMSGEATPAQIGGFLVALRLKGETADEIAGSAEGMRGPRPPVSPKRDDLVDTAGTGGDGGKTFNISTAAASLPPLRARASRSTEQVRLRPGSVDVLEALGFDVALSPARIAESIDTLGFGFMFAPTHHPAMKHAHRSGGSLLRVPFSTCSGADEPCRRPRSGRRRLSPELVR